MGHSTARFEAIKTITNYKPTDPPLNFKELSSHECFGANVFSLAEMQKRLPKPIFKSLKRTIESGAKLDATVADVVATATQENLPRHVASCKVATVLSSRRVSHRGCLQTAGRVFTTFFRILCS